MERIANEIGIAFPTLYRWKKRHGWQRPSGPERRGPTFYRYRQRGRPYGADAVGTARDLIAGSTLSLRAVAARVGVNLTTLQRWTERPGWPRHPARDTRGPRPTYGPEVVAAARDLYVSTRLTKRLIAARVGTTRERVSHWARKHGWTRPPRGSDRVRPESAREAAWRRLKEMG